MSDVPEIERRWILKKMPEVVVFESIEVPREVGYIFNDHGELRVVRKHKKKGKSYQLTIKDDGGLVRNEWQEKIPEWAFKVLWPKTEGRRLTVSRYIYDWKGYKLEFDKYNGRFNGLVKLECEFESREQAWDFKPPPWVEVVCEVTEDVLFNNKNLAALDSLQATELLNKVFK